METEYSQQFLQYGEVKKSR